MKTRTVIFQKSTKTKRGNLRNFHTENLLNIPKELLRKQLAQLPNVSELEVVRHYTQLSQLNFSIDTHMYPLGSCTMKYNPRVAHELATLNEYLSLHPLLPEIHYQDLMKCLYDLQTYLGEMTGLPFVCLSPMAGSQGEFAGVAMIKAYHQSRHDHKRHRILVPNSAHGTNPATAAMCGYEIVEIPTNVEGDVDIKALISSLNEEVAGMMLTNPSTLGVFERSIQKISELVHAAGALMYYDGANLNAILGKMKPSDMGFDVMHINLHKTFATPHGGGGPGAGPVCCNQLLKPFLPIPYIHKKNEQYVWQNKTECPQSIGRLSAWMGNFNVLIRAYIYISMLGRDGIQRVSDYAVLNANYLMHHLQKIGYQLVLPNRRASHEFVITLKKEKLQYGISALDVVKRLLDFGIHAPTVYFPIMVPECLLLEPTETESKQSLDEFVEAMRRIRAEIENEPDKLKNAPYTTPCRRLDEVKAAKDINVIEPEEET